MKATERLYLTVDRTRVVAEGDPDAAFLWKTPGKDISAAEAKQYGITEPKKAKDEPRAEEELAEAKAVEEPPENKAQTRSSRKADGD